MDIDLSVLLSLLSSVRVGVTHASPKSTIRHSSRTVIVSWEISARYVRLVCHLRARCRLIWSSLLLNWTPMADWSRHFGASCEVSVFRPLSRDFVCPVAPGPFCLPMRGIPAISEPVLVKVLLITVESRTGAPTVGSGGGSVAFPARRERAELESRHVLSATISSSPGAIGRWARADADWTAAPSSGGTVPLRRRKTLPECQPFPVMGRVGGFTPWSCIARSVWRAGTG